MKKLFTNNLVSGEKFVKEAFLVKRIDDQLYFSDRKGKAKANIAPNKKITLTPETIYLVSGSILPIGNECVLFISDAKEAEEGEYNPIDIYGALPEEKILEYKKEIRTLIGKIKHKGYQALVRVCLTDEVLERLSNITIPGETWGNYCGAPLAALSQVPFMACGCACSFVKRANGISHKEIDQDLLLTAGLLHEYARSAFVDTDNAERKSHIGIIMNHFALLVVMLERAKMQIEEGLLSEEAYALLINALEVSITRSATCAISREGMILRSIINLYHEIDAYDWQVILKPVDEGEGYYYSNKIDCYIVGGKAYDK